jgi:hypothetical protein
MAVIVTPAHAQMPGSTPVFIVVMARICTNYLIGFPQQFGQFIDVNDMGYRCGHCKYST